MTASPGPVEIFFPFFQKDLIEIFRFFKDSQFCHDLRIQKVIFKRVVFQHQYIFGRYSWEAVHIFQVPFFVVFTQGADQLFMVFPVSVPDHEKLILQVHLVHVFEICIGLNIGAAVGSDNGHPGQTAVFVVDLGIILFQEKGKTAFILFSLDDKYEIHTQKISCRVAQIFQHPGEIRLFPDGGKSLFIQKDLTDLPAVKGRQQIGRVGGKDYLAFFGKPVQDLAGGFLKLGMEKDFRILHKENGGEPAVVFHIGFQKRQKVNAPHSLSQLSYRGRLLLIFLADISLYLEKLSGVGGKIIGDFSVITAVFSEILIYFIREIFQIHMIQLIFQELFCLKSIQLFRRFPVQKTDTGKTVGTLFHRVEKAAVHPHLVQQIVLCKRQEIALDFFQIPFAVQKIDRGKNLGNVPVIFMKAIMIPDAAVLVGNIGKSQLVILKRGKFLAEIPVPGIPSFIGADLFGMK